MSRACLRKAPNPYLQEDICLVRRFLKNLESLRVASLDLRAPHLSGLLEAAIAGVRALDPDTYMPFCVNWYAITDLNVCEVCLVGTLMAGSLKNSPSMTISLEKFSNNTENKLRAVDSMRGGNWLLAVGFVYGQCPEEIAARLRILSQAEAFELHLLGPPPRPPGFSRIDSSATARGRRARRCSAILTVRRAFRRRASLRDPVEYLAGGDHPTFGRQLLHELPLERLMMLDSEVTIAAGRQQDVERQLGRSASPIIPLELRRAVPHPLGFHSFHHRMSGFSPADHVLELHCVHPRTRLPRRSSLVAAAARMLRCRSSFPVAQRFLFRHGRRAAPSSFVINFRSLLPSLMRGPVSARFSLSGHR